MATLFIPALANRRGSGCDRQQPAAPDNRIGYPADQAFFLKLAAHQPHALMPDMATCGQFGVTERTFFFKKHQRFGL